MNITRAVMVGVTVCCLAGGSTGSFSQSQIGKTGSGGIDGQELAGGLPVVPIAAATAVAVAIGVAIAVAASDRPGGGATSTVTGTAITTRPR